MPKKYLRVTMPDGSRWDVPAEFIAKHRARYYVDKDPKYSYFDKEVKYALEDDYELMDWAANNMNWKDVKEQARIVEEAREVDYQEGWINGACEVITKEGE